MSSRVSMQPGTQNERTLLSSHPALRTAATTQRHHRQEIQGVSLHGGKESLSYEDNTRVRGIHPAGKEMALRLEEHALEYVLATFRGWWWGISVANDPFL